MEYIAHLKLNKVHALGHGKEVYMRNIEIIKSFITREAINKRTPNLYINDTPTNYQLINYSTIIAIIYKNDMNTVYINLKYYSNTTRKVQSHIIEEARRKGLAMQLMAHNDILENVEYINYKGLAKDLFTSKIMAVYQYGLNALQAIDIVHGIEDRLLFMHNDKVYSRVIKYDAYNPYINYNGRCYLRDFLRIAIF